MLRKAKTQNIQFATRLQMVAVIREADGEPVSVLAKRHGISLHMAQAFRCLSGEGHLCA
jgi:hypothetical protein